jgi:hypothetical protein
LQTPSLPVAPDWQADSIIYQPDPAVAGVEEHLGDSPQPWRQRRIYPLGAPRIARRELRVQRGQDRPAIRLCVKKMV